MKKWLIAPLKGTTTIRACHNPATLPPADRDEQTNLIKEIEAMHHAWLWQGMSDAAGDGRGGYKQRCGGW
jgi:hypothetical protein